MKKFAFNPSAFFESDASAFSQQAGNRIYIQGQEDFSWSVGTRATLWECGCTSVGAEFQWFSTRQKVQRIVNYGTAVTTTDLTRSSIALNYTDWQIGIGVSHRINLLVPYMGLTFGTAQAKFGNAVIGGVDLNTLESYKIWGYAVGVSLVDCEKMSLTAEVDLARETAAFVSGEFRF